MICIFFFQSKQVAGKKGESHWQRTHLRHIHFTDGGGGGQRSKVGGGGRRKMWYQLSRCAGRGHSNIHWTQILVNKMFVHVYVYVDETLPTMFSVKKKTWLLRYIHCSLCIKLFYLFFLNIKICLDIKDGILFIGK